MKQAHVDRFERLKVSELLKGAATLDPQRRVSPHSRLGDPIWDFREPDNQRVDSVPDSRLVINWGMYSMPREQRQFRAGIRVIGHLTAFLPAGIIEELKVLCLLVMELPASAFGSSGKQKVKPNTAIVSVRSLICLFSDILDVYAKLSAQSRRLPLSIQSVCDVTLDDIQQAVAASPRKDGARLSSYLAKLASPLMAKFLPRPLEWNPADLDDVDFKFPEKRTDYSPVMPDDLFRLLSDTACADVKGFLKFLKLRPQDRYEGAKKATFSHERGPELFAQYIEIRTVDRAHTYRTGKRSNNDSGKQRRAFKARYGVAPETFQIHISRVQRACFTLIGMYTGGRYTDLRTFTNDCVGEKFGMSMLFATEVKRRDVNAPENFDIWPAIPIMLDALTCLQHISQVTFNPFLLGSTYTVGIGEEPAPLSYGAFVEAINLYLAEIDKSGRWAHTRLSSNSLRHTLAYQLGRLDVNPVYISIQLKHLDAAFRALPPNITLTYGNQGQLALQRAMGAERASIEATKELFALHAPLAGGGAEEFKQRKKTWFAGMMAQGYTEEQLVEMLAAQGLPFVAVGGGYCGGKRDIVMKDGTRQLPPCLGQLHCSPDDCHQGVITAAHIPHWQEVLSQNEERASDPLMGHAKEHLEAAARKARNVLHIITQRPEDDEEDEG